MGSLGLQLPAFAAAGPVGRLQGAWATPGSEVEGPVEGPLELEGPEELEGPSCAPAALLGVLVCGGGLGTAHAGSCGPWGKAPGAPDEPVRSKGSEGSRLVDSLTAC